MAAAPPVKSSLPATWTALPETLRARIGETAGRQRAMAAERHLLLVLHGPPGPDDDLRNGRFFWRDPAGNWKASSGGSGSQAVRNHLQEFNAALDRLEERLHSADSAEDYFLLLQAIAPLHRTTRNMHAALQQARELVPEDREILALRDRAGELEREAELLHTDAKNGLDYTVARRSEQLARQSYAMSVSAHRLNMLAALFFPLATFSSVLGMNLIHGWENDRSTVPFWITLGAGFVSGLLLMALIASRSDAAAVKIRNLGEVKNSGPIQE